MKKIIIYNFFIRKVFIFVYMGHKIDKFEPINMTLQHELRDKVYSISWVIEDDGMANGFDEESNQWQGIWTGDSVIDIRKA